MKELPAPVDDWPLADRIRWILRQPAGEETILDRIITLVHNEKDKSVELATTINICSTSGHPQ